MEYLAPCRGFPHTHTPAKLLQLFHLAPVFVVFLWVGFFVGFFFLGGGGGCFFLLMAKSHFLAGNCRALELFDSKSSDLGRCLQHYCVAVLEVLYIGMFV